MSTRKLLLADDSITIQKVVNLTFADEGIEVISAGDGDSAMQKFAENIPDLVLADVNMPGLNGYQICEQIRGSEATKDIPVILLVGSFEPFDENEARRVGANDFLTKPFQSIRQLVNKVTDLIEGKNGKATESQREEADDIESLYKESFDKTAEFPQAAAATTALGDAGMDDEMIETFYAVGSSAATESVAAAETNGEPEAEDDFGSAFESSAGEVRSEETVETYTIDADSDAVIDFGEPEVVVPSGIANEEASVATFDSPLDSEMGETSFQSELQRQTYSDSAPAFDHEEVTGTPESLPQAAEQATEPDFRIDESNLLELPSTEGPTGFVMTPSVEKPVGNEPPGEMSPEFIDAVAQKVLEKISEVAVRDIAWRVVPQIAESVVREKTEGGHR